MKELYPMIGVIPAMNVGFTEDNKIDLEGLEKHTQYAVDSGVAGLLIPVVATEVGTLTPEERADIIDTTVRIAKGKAKVNGFYYKKTRSKYTLLSAIDPSTVVGDVVIPDCIGNYYVSDALSSAFRNCSGISKLSIPDTLQSILPESMLPSQAEIIWYDSSLPQNDFDIIIPEQIQVGQDLPVLFSTTQNTQDYSFVIERYDNPLDWRPNCYTSGQYYSDGWRQYTFLGYELELEPGYYYITVTTSSFMIDTVYTARMDFTVIDGQRPAAPNVTTDKAVYEYGDEIVFSIDTRNADKWSYWTDSGGMVSIDVKEDTTIWKSTANSSSYRISVCKDGVWSGLISVNVSINQPELVYSFEVQVPDQIQVGQDLPVYFETVKYAQSYSLYIGSYDVTLDWNPNVYFSGEYLDGWKETTFIGYEHKLGPGHYYVQITARNNQLDLNIVEKVDFTVIDGLRPASPGVTTDKETYEFGEEIIISIDTSNADKWAHFTDSGGMLSIDVKDDTTIWKTSANSSKYIIYICKDGIWSEGVSVPVVIE